MNEENLKDLYNRYVYQNWFDIKDIKSIISLMMEKLLLFNISNLKEKYFKLHLPKLFQ